jgi:hypothetical protein
MAKIQSYPPPPPIIGRLAALPGARLSPGAVFAVDGPRPSGPEQAGAVLILQTTLAGEEPAGRFWNANADVLTAAVESPGFIRFIGFAEGLCNYAIVFWRTADEAHAFADGAEHRTAVRDLYRTPSQYSHFARLFEGTGRGMRHFFCERCGRVTPAPASVCAGCGNALSDVFEDYARPEPASP